MKRLVSIATAALIVVGLIAAPSASADQRGATRTEVAGGWEGSPPVIPVSADPETYTFHVVGHAIFDGTWVGLSVFEMDAKVDPATGDYVASAKTTFTGAWTADGSHGTLRWHENMTGNLITGAFNGTFDIESGSGDPSFQCSSGHFTWSGFSPPPASYGGYAGTWIHGCRK